jgi:DNA-binding NarL/FixJ family response regulator
VRVAIAEDSVLLREGLAQLLTDADIEVTARCGQPMSYWHASQKTRPTPSSSTSGYPRPTPMKGCERL